MEFFDGGWPRYVSVAERRAKAERKLQALKKKGTHCQPVEVEGRTIARTFWGKKWCDNLEAYSDYANRLPRGRSYVRNGAVIDLQIANGQIDALVAGSSVYRVHITVQALDTTRWKTIRTECAGKVQSLIELLQGRLSSAVMDVVTRHGSGLFPAPSEITFGCSCPDSATLCKHVAAALYGVGTRLDTQPDLLFLLRHLDPQELVQEAVKMPALHTQTAVAPQQSLEHADLSALFGIDIATPPIPTAVPVADKKSPAKKSTAPTRKKRGKLLTARELIARGIPQHRVQGWLRSGVLLRSEVRGVYGVTPRTEACIEDYLQKHRA